MITSCHDHVMTKPHIALFAEQVMAWLRPLEQFQIFIEINTTQVNRMSRSRRVLAIGGKRRINGLGMVCIETILFHLESF